MKKALLACLACATMPATSVFAQNPVPNSSFENWTSGEPDDWFTSNVPGFATNVIQTTPAYSGNLAARGDVINSPAGAYPPSLFSTDINGNGFPVSQSYGAVEFYYKFTKAATASFLMVSSLIDANLQGVAASLFSTTTATSSFTLATAPFLYVGANPDQCVIQFTIIDSLSGGPVAGNSFVVDEVSLTGTVSISEQRGPVFMIEKITPNPASGQATVYYGTTLQGNVEFQVMDLHGRIIQRFGVPAEIPGRHKLDVDVTGLAPGVYLVRMQSAEGSAVLRMGVTR